MQPENEIQEKEKVFDTPEMEVKVAEEVLDESAKIADGKDSDTEGPGDEKNKMSKKQIIGLVVLSLIAIGGVLFGVYGMNSQNEQIAELKGQVSSADEKVAQLETEVAKNDDVAIDDEVEIVDDANVVAADAVDTADYIYGGEWGLKIKMPENLKRVRYDFESLTSSSSSLSIRGADYDGQYFPNMTEVSRPDSDFILFGGVERIIKGTDVSYLLPVPKFIFSDDSYDYYYIEKQIPHQAQAENEASRQDELINLLNDTLTNPDNYSTI